MNSIKIAGINDLQIVHDLAHQIWPYAYGNILSVDQLEYMLNQIYSTPALQKQLIASGHQFIIAYTDEKPTGFAAFSLKDNSSIFRLHKIYILLQQQGTGLGIMLLNYVINEGRKAGATVLQLNVNRNNIARNFYEKHGFTIIETEDIDIGNGYFMNDYIMELSLI